MKILAVEFSSERRSVAVVESGRILAEAFEMGGRAAIELVEKALAAAKVEREQIDCIAIGIGPGSYTGIRGAISLAQGWQLARDVKLIGISSVACIAAQAQQDKLFGKIAVVVDAQREEFYLSVFEISEEAVNEIDPLKIVPAAEVEKLAIDRITIVGPDALAFCGEGCPRANVRRTFPKASTLGQLASQRTDFVAGEKLEPIYLREVSFKKVSPPTHVNL